ncbi:MAG TPA: hypothetical protein PKA29_00430 [Candidatus Saccharibacteria bacterium]|nr:hypothetical protein [Candidatus Saccharibacteria bacterium]
MSNEKQPSPETTIDQPLFFFMNEKFTIGNPPGVAESNRTEDYTLEEFATNGGEILDILGMPNFGDTSSSAPHCAREELTPEQEREGLTKRMADLLCAYSTYKKKEKDGYLQDPQAVIRVLITDEDLRERVLSARAAEAKEHNDRQLQMN